MYRCSDNVRVESGGLFEGTTGLVPRIKSPEFIFLDLKTIKRSYKAIEFRHVVFTKPGFCLFNCGEQENLSAISVFHPKIIRGNPIPQVLFSLKS